MHERGNGLAKLPRESESEMGREPERADADVTARWGTKCAICPIRQSRLSISTGGECSARSRGSAQLVCGSINPRNEPSADYAVDEQEAGK